MLSTRQLRYFVEIAECGSFSAAAERLFVAQSALSRQIKDMETRLQTPLFERTARQPRLTAAGEAFISIPHPQRGGLSYLCADLCMRQGFFPQAARVMSRKTTQLQLIQAGFGIALLPESMQDIAPPGVRFLPLADPDCKSTVALAYRHNPPPLIQHFIQTFTM